MTALLRLEYSLKAQVVKNLLAMWETRVQSRVGTIPWRRTPPANAGDARDLGLIPGLGRSPGGGNGNPLQYSCLENPMDRGAWQAAVQGVAKSQTGLSEHASYVECWHRLHSI